MSEQSTATGPTDGRSPLPPGEVPVMTSTEEERRSGALDDGRLAQAEHTFREYGTLALHGAYPVELVDRLRTWFTRHYRGALEAPVRSDRRKLFTVAVEGPFADELFYRNPLVFPLVQRLLGDDCVIGACSAVVSWPGAPQQFIHRDSAPLFGKDYFTADYTWDIDLPPYAVTCLIPLIDIDPSIGGTRVWPRTHVEPRFEVARAAPHSVPELRRGSVLINDSRVVHCGEGNSSGGTRPLVYITYHRLWYRDWGGYGTRPPVDITWSGKRSIPPAHRRLFRIAEEGSLAELAGRAVRRFTGRVLPSRDRERP